MARLIPDEFVPLHVHYRRDRAIRKAGPDAELLFIRALAFARANRTGGMIEDFDLDEIGAGLNDPTASATALVDVNLWLTSGTGWIIRSFEKWNPAGASESGTFGNHKRWHLDRGLVAPNCPHCPAEPSPDDPPIIAPESPRSSPRVGGDIAPISGGIAEERRGEEMRGDESDALTRGTTKSRKRPSTPLPDSWEPSPSNIAYATANGIDIEHQAGQFRAHHLAKDSRFSNWDQAFRTWLGNSGRFGSQRPQPTGTFRVVGGTEWE